MEFVGISDGYINLAGAVIKKAIYDYEQAKRQNNTIEMSRIERFLVESPLTLSMGDYFQSYISQL